jgi:murein DD-endopeptidase MepM/ murein hydrolase activator NlpD
MTRTTGLAAGAVVLLMVLCGFIAIPLVANPAFACGRDVPAVDPSVGGNGFEQWSGVQVQHAAEIVAAGKAMDIPPRGWVIALATAMQESTLRNLANDNPRYPLVVAHSLAIPHDGVGHDHDSVGLMQQRPLPPEGAGGWGTVAELMTPTTAARKFYGALQHVDGWQTMSVTAAAQAVQHSAFEDAYAKWEDEASRLAAYVSGLPDIADIGGGPPGAECGPSNDGTASISADGWTLPAPGPIWSGFRPPSRHTHDGIDIGAPRYTNIHAAADGVVITSKCNSTIGCDVDGSPQVHGCGWYVEINHGGGITTRYCHQVHEPYVHVGDHVTAGQVIGQVGSTGNSSAPHLHFEVHVGVPAGNTGSSADAVSPIDFMATHGVQLGQ